jgi:hypothetical protein
VTVLAFVALLAVGCEGGVQVDAQAGRLVHLMAKSGQFRVRVQAALALSKVAIGDTSVTEALVQALRDEHPAVRAAAAWSLQARANPAVLYALRAAESDGDPGVALAATRAVVALEEVAQALPSASDFHDQR